MKSDQKDKMAHDLANILNHFKRRGFHKRANRSIRPSELMLLSNLANLTGNTEKGIKVSDFSNHLQVTPAAVTHIIDMLVEKKFVERLSDPDDRRIVLIRTTKKGLEMVKNMENKILKKCGELIDFLGEIDSKEFIRLLSTAFGFFDKMEL